MTATGSIAGGVMMEGFNGKYMDRNGRLESLDALRGFDMFFIMGLSSLISALCVAFGHADCWLDLQMDHVQWNGLSHHDTIFPLFLFIAGVSFPYSFAKNRDHIYSKIFKRAAVLIFFGMIYNGLLEFDFTTARFYSVLGRIGLAWMGAALLYVRFGRKTRAAICAIILFAYWFICMIPAPDVPGADPLSFEGNIVGWLDRKLFAGHLCYGTFDPEGLISTLPAIVTAMLGMFSGELLRNKDLSGNRKTVILLAAAVALLAAGLLWSIVFPVNKKLWSSSFVLVVGAYSAAMLAIFYWIIDVRGCRKWAFPFKVVGINSIASYMLPAIIGYGQSAKFLFGGFASLFPEEWSTVVLRAAYLLVAWSVLYFMYRKKVFLKV